MKRFRSRVAALKELRQRREEQALQVHARALRTRRAAEDRLEACLGALLRHRQDVQAELLQGCPASRLAQNDGYRSLLEQRWQESRRQVAEAAAAADASLQALLKTRRDREVVEKFCTKEWADHQRDQLRQDQKNLDEMALRRRAADRSFQQTPRKP